MARITASEQTRKQIAEVCVVIDKSALLRNRVRLIVRRSVGARHDVGWATTERANRPGNRQWQRVLGRLKTAEGSWSMPCTQVTGTAAPWASEVKASLVRRTEELERRCGDVRAGVVERDIEACPSPVRRALRADQKWRPCQVTERCGGLFGVCGP